MSAIPTEAANIPPVAPDTTPKSNGKTAEQPAAAVAKSAAAQTLAGADEPPKPTFRGPLRYEVETASSQLEAGKSFSIFIKITNPYDLPVKIISAKTEVPVEFMDADEQPVSFLQSLRGSAARAERAAGRRARRSYVVSAVNVSVKEKVPVEGEEEEPVMLQPGNSGLYEFKLCTRDVYFFTPSLYTLHMQVQYDMDAARNHDTVKHQMNIRSPLKALILGAVVGGWLGTILTNLLTNLTTATSTYWPTPYFMGKLLTSVLLGAVLVIAFARKKDAQPFLSVEDFYGGFFIGFLAAYVGASLLTNLIKT